jgi:nitrite reductase/ring-hydroxylating ferredoxin subunit
VTLGAWSMGALLDLVGARREADGALTVGVLSAIPTAMAGAADWVDTSEQPRRIGLIHAVLNSGGLALIIASLFARRTNHRGLGIGLSTLGLSLASLSAWLGGELVYRFGTGVSRIAFEPGVEEFQVVAAVDKLEPGKLFSASATVDGVKLPLVLLKKGNSVDAVSGLCPHWGGPLGEGKLLEGDVVECPWHASQFRISDGSVCQGPASAPLHMYEARIRDGNVEVRRHSA